MSPVIVVPGPWTQSDIDFHGVNLSTMLTNNAGFNCNATRVVINHEGWTLRRALLDATKAAFAAAPPRAAYYPGAQARYEAFLEAHPEAEQIGAAGEGELPWMLVEGLDPEVEDDICFTTEAFCSVTSEVAIPATHVIEYIDKAVEFCNETLWGTLNAAIIVHPKSMEDPGVAAAVERAIANLRYGSVVVNHWPALSYGLVTTTWGAFPGHTLQDIRSGIGVVHNTYMFDKPQKSVIRGQFRMFPKPPWFNNHKLAHKLAPKIVDFEAAPSWLKLPGIIFDAARG